MTRDMIISAADNWRFGTTAARSANLKSSGETPPLRQAATTLSASGGQRNEKLTTKHEK